MTKQAKLMGATSDLLHNLEREEKILLRYSRGSLWMYRDGYWRTVDAAEQEVLDAYYLVACDANEVPFGKDYTALRRTLNAVVSAKGMEFDTYPRAALANGTLDFKTRELEEWNPDHLTTRSLAQAWVPGATAPRWQEMLWRMLDDPNRTDDDIERMICFLQEWVGVNIVGDFAKGNRRPLRQALIIEGPSGTGKSTFASVVRELFGTSRVVAPDFKSLNTNFGLNVLVNAQALIGDDKLSDGSRSNEGALKALVTGEPITTDRKFMEPITFTYGGAILFTANGLPSIDDATDAIYGRFLVVRMTRVFNAADQQKDLGGLSPIAYLTEHEQWPGILNWALEGADRAMERGRFELSAEITDAAKMFRTQNDPSYGFVNDCIVRNPKASVPFPVLAALSQRYALDQNGKKWALRKAGDAAARAITERWDDVELERSASSPAPSRVLGVGLSSHALALWTAVAESKLPSLEGYRTPVQPIA